MSLLLTESFDAHPTNSGTSIGTYLNTKHGRYVTGLSGLQGGFSSGVSGSPGAGSGGVTGRTGTGLSLRGNWVSGGPPSHLRSTGLISLLEEGAEVDTLVVGFACNVVDAADDLDIHRLVSFGEHRAAGQLDHVDFFLAPSGIVRVKCGSTLLGTFALATGAYYFLEFKVKVSSTVGTIEVRKDGAIAFTFSGNTRNGGTGLISRVRWETPVPATVNTATEFVIDDLYIVDTLGTAANDFLGDVIVEYLQPSAAGSSTGWTPSAGSNWDCVSDPVATTTPLTTDYVSNATLGTVDTYALADSAQATTRLCYGVASYAYADKAAAGARALKLIQELSAVRIETGAQVLKYSAEGGPQYLRFPRSLDPSGAAWTVVNVNSLQIGQRVA